MAVSAVGPSPAIFVAVDGEETVYDYTYPAYDPRRYYNGDWTAAFNNAILSLPNPIYDAADPPNLVTLGGGVVDATGLTTGIGDEITLSEIALSDTIYVGDTDKPVNLLLGVTKYVFNNGSESDHPAFKLAQSSSMYGAGWGTDIHCVGLGDAIQMEACCIVKDLRLHDDNPESRTSPGTGNGIEILSSTGTAKCKVESVVVENFYYGVHGTSLFVSEFDHLDVAGTVSHAYMFAAGDVGGSSLLLSNCYANHCGGCGYYFEGHYEYCSLITCAADVCGSYAFYLGRTAAELPENENPNFNFTFNSCSSEQNDPVFPVSDAVHCIKGGGHVFNACEFFVNDAGESEANGYVFEGTKDVTINKGSVQGFENGYAVYVVESEDEMVPKRITVDPPRLGAPAGWGGGLGMLYDPTLAVQLAWEDWQELDLSSGWSSFQPENSFQPPQFMKDRSGIVHLRGMMKGPTTPPSPPVTMATLPAGYRPSLREMFPALSDGSLGTLEVQPNGSVVLWTTPTGFVSLSGILFGAGA